jgi:hypothetical protein
LPSYARAIFVAKRNDRDEQALTCAPTPGEFAPPPVQAIAGQPRGPCDRRLVMTLECDC